VESTAKKRRKMSQLRILEEVSLRLPSIDREAIDLRAFIFGEYRIAF
jgi:hypothetical protein